MVLAVVGMAADQEVLSVDIVEAGTGDVVVSVIFRGGGTTVVVVVTGNLDTVDSGVVTSMVVVLQSVTAKVGLDATVVIGSAIVLDVGNSGTVVVEVVSSVRVVYSNFSVVTDGDVVSGLKYGVVFLVVKVTVANCVVLAEVTMGKDIVPVSTGGRVGRGEAVVCAVLGKPGGVVVVVGGGRLSTVIAFVVVSVVVVVAVLGTVVLSVTKDVSETGAGVEAVTIEETIGECVVASVVSLVGCTTRGEVLMVVGGMVVVGCRGAVVVVKSGCRESVGLVEEVNRVVTVEGALVLDVLKGLRVELGALVIRAVVAVKVVGRASVTLTVDRGSTTSGLTVGGAVGEDGGSDVLESSGAAEGEVVTG